ncbi:MAG TPA: peptidase [Thermoanaerobaculia bacterium]|nr:peptidase [Thermoanaerobaculia bacterium]
MRSPHISLAALLAISLAPLPATAETKPAARPAGGKAAAARELAVVPDIERRLAQYAPTRLGADLAGLSAADRKALGLLVQASSRLNDVFLRQTSVRNPELAKELAALRGPGADAARAYFELNAGLWDRLDGMKPFVGHHPNPEGAGYYPEDLTRQEFEAWLTAHPADKERFTSTVTVIRRRPGHPKELMAVPYPEEYRAWLEPAAKELRAAAAATDNATLKRFLALRADAFLSNDYYASDLAWMDLDAPVEVTIGPYETYSDGLFGYKAAFEAYVTLALPQESAALARYKERLPFLEKNLPLPDADKNLNRGTESPIRVVDVVYAAGEATAGVPAVAYNLPNDERVREAKGSKKILLKNLMRAKYDQILVPISQQVLDASQVPAVSFDAYFDEVLHHELSHGLGPGTITVDGKKTEVRLELKDLFSTIEEAKADVMGIYNILALIERGDMPADLRRALEPTYVAGLFRSARFGTEEAHGQGVVSQFNYLLEKGALTVDASAHFRADSEKFPGAIRDLLHDLLMLQARGDYAGTKRFLDKYGHAGDALKTALGRLQAVPVDIRPIYPLSPEGAGK